MNQLAETDMKRMVEEFKQRLESLPLRDLFFVAGQVVETLARLLKKKVYVELGIEEVKRERTVRIETRKILEPEPVEEAPINDLDWLWKHEARIGRPLGSKTIQTNKQKKPCEKLPLHKEFKVEEYQKVVSDMDFTMLKNFIMQIPDRTERVRYFLAWLYL